MGLVKMNEEDLLRELMRLKLEKFIYLNLVMDYSPYIHGNIAIYGAGMLGKLLYRSFDSKPVAFIDKKEALDRICDTPVYSLHHCSKEIMDKIDVVIVTPIWAFDEIEKNIKGICERVNVLSLAKLVEKL